MERVFNYGPWKDQVAISKFYGLSRIRKEIVNAGYLRTPVLSFLCTILNLKKTDFACYNKKQFHPLPWTRRYYSYDITALLNDFSLQEMLEIFKVKFPQIDPGFIIHSLTDFEKADADLDPDTYINTSWKEIKERLKVEVKNYINRLIN